MKRNIPKKLLSVLLAVMLVFAAVPVAYQAEPETKALAATATSDELSLLRDAIGHFWYLFRNGGIVYKDMRTGYDYYCTAMKLYDAAYYGDGKDASGNEITSDQINTAKTNLKTWCQNAQQWQPITEDDITNPTLKYGDSDDDVPAGDYSVQSCLYASDPVVGGHTSTSQMDHGGYVWYMPKNAVFITGHGGVPRMPVEMAFHNFGGLSIYVAPNTLMATDNSKDNPTVSDKKYTTGTYNHDNAYFKFTRPWVGYLKVVTGGGNENGSSGAFGIKNNIAPTVSELNWSGAFSYETSGTNNGVPGYDATSNDASNVDNKGDIITSNVEKLYRMYCGFLQYVGGSEDFDNCLQTINIGMMGRSSQYRGINLGTFKDDGYFEVFNDCATYYVIDYSKVQTTISKALQEYLNFGVRTTSVTSSAADDGTKYVNVTPGTGSKNGRWANNELDDLLDAIAILEEDPTTGFTSSNWLDRAKAVSSRIQEGIDKVAAARTTLESKTDSARVYQTLRDKMYMTGNTSTSDNARTVYDAGNTNPKVWITRTWTPFETAYSSAQSIFDAVTAGYSTASDLSSTISTNATSVNDTFLALTKIADFTPIDDAIKALQAEIGPNGDNKDQYHLKSDVESLLDDLNNATNYPYFYYFNTTPKREGDEQANGNYATASDNDAITTEANKIKSDITAALAAKDRVDTSALEAAIDTAKAAVDSDDPDAYSNIDGISSGLITLDSVKEDITSPSTPAVVATYPTVVTKTSTDVDSSISDTVSKLTLRQYTVTLNGTTEGTYDYGTVKTYTSSTGEPVDWKYTCVSYTGKKTESTIQNRAEVTVNVNGTVTLDEVKATKSDQVKVTYKSKPLGKEYYVAYVDKGTTITSSSIGHPNYFGYDFTGYSQDSITANEDTVVYANYTAKSSTTYTIGFVNAPLTANLTGFETPENNTYASEVASQEIPFNERMEFDSNLMTYDGNPDYILADDTYLPYKLGGEFAEDDKTVITEPTLAALPNMDLDGDPLYAISMVPKDNYEKWTGDGSTTGRNAVKKSEYGITSYDTETAANTERLLAVGENLDYVWYAQEDCYLVFYTKDEFEDAIKGNVFEGIDADANAEQVAVSYAYKNATNVVDNSNGDNNHIDFRGSATAVPAGATFVETGFIFSYKKDGSATENQAIANTTLDLKNVDNSKGVCRLKISNNKLTRYGYNTGYQYAMKFKTKSSTWSGHTLYIKYRTYVNYKVGGKLYTAYSDEITSDYTF